MPPQHVRQRAAAAELSAPRLTVWLRDRVTGRPRPATSAGGIMRWRPAT